MVSQSPIEAAIWTSFVAMQQWIVDNFLSGVPFKAVVVTFLGISLIRLIMGLGQSHGRFPLFMRFVWLMLISFVGMALLQTKNTSAFKPLTASGKAWQETPRASVHFKGTQKSWQQTQGLYYYVLIHRAFNQIADQMSTQVGQFFSAEQQAKSPYLLLQALSQTAMQNIDDPEALGHFDFLLDNCTGKSLSPVVLNSEDSYSKIFDLQAPPCAAHYQGLRQSLERWGSTQWRRLSVGEMLRLGASEIQAKLGLASESAWKNKMIASALISAARQKMGRNPMNVNQKALLDSEFTGSEDVGWTSYFVSLGNAFGSFGGFLNGVLSPFTGGDYFGADARNQSASMYNRMLQFMPALRGYAKGFLALSFVFAAAALCVGQARFMISWLGMLTLFSAYEPLSTLLYHSTFMLSQSNSVSQSFGALQNDPLVLAGAAIIDDNLARIQTVYFALQLTLAASCAFGGVSLFVFARRIGQGMSDALMSKAATIIHMAPK